METIPQTPAATPAANHNTTARSLNRGRRRGPKGPNNRGPATGVLPPAVHDSAASATGAPGHPPRRRNRRFNAKLSDNTNGKTGSEKAAASEHSHSHSHAARALPPDVPTDSLLARLTLQLSNESYECLFCFNEIRRHHAIHSCTTCHAPFHLRCIKDWASKSLETSEEWRCPACQTHYNRSEAPTEYFCFCGRTKKPQPKASATPHSCAQPCARPRGCSHPCPLMCHPGPCPDCVVVIEEKCYCSKEIIRLPCYERLGSFKKPNAIDFLKCGSVCGKALNCGLHTCSQTCHPGSCGDCQEVRPKSCYCGSNSLDEPCGVIRKPVTSCIVSGTPTETVTGEYACSKTCTVPYDCGHHVCNKTCHPHLSVEPCPFSPNVLTSCPCGKVSLTELLTSPRADCRAPIPTCANECGKKLPNCEHTCRQKCHQGDCSKMQCQVSVTIVCRCGNSKKTKPCFEITNSDEEFTCDRVCKALRNCGKHECARRCCPLSYLEANRAKKGKKRTEDFMSQDILVPYDTEGLHTCQLTCGKKLSCGVHSCEQKDHKGPCPPCLRAIFDEITCNCGRTTLIPPQPCNTKVICGHPCTRIPSCGHPSIPHRCHENENGCPTCPYLMTKTCACGKKEIANVRCSQDSSTVSCGQVCGKKLSCGFHQCLRRCHPAEEKCEEERCTQKCSKPKSLCEHLCDKKCHAPSACSEEDPCQDLIEIHCECGNLTQKVKCGARTSKVEGNHGRLLQCTDECRRLERNRRLAEALGISETRPTVAEGQNSTDVPTEKARYIWDTFEFYRAHRAYATQIEKLLRDFMADREKKTLYMPVMKRLQRKFVYELLEVYGLRGESVDPEPKRSVIVYKGGEPIASKIAERVQHFPPLALIKESDLHDPTRPVAEEETKEPEEVGKEEVDVPEASNGEESKQAEEVSSLILGGVLGLDERELTDLIQIHMKSYPFELQWIDDEEVQVSFDQKIQENDMFEIELSLLQLAEETGFISEVRVM